MASRNELESSRIIALEYAKLLEQLPPDDPELSFLKAHLALLVTHIRSWESSESLSLEDTWKDQAEALAYLFARTLGLSQQKYMKSLPPYPEKPDSYEGKPCIPVIVQVPNPDLPLDEILDRIGIINDLDGAKIDDWQDDPRKFATPSGLYTTWLYISNSQSPKATEQARRKLRSFERGATIYDGIALFITNPGLLTQQFFTFPGSQIDNDDIPYLRMFQGRLHLRRFYVDGPSGRQTTSLLASRAINIAA